MALAVAAGPQGSLPHGVCSQEAEKAEGWCSGGFFFLSPKSGWMVLSTLSLGLHSLVKPLWEHAPSPTIGVSL